MFLLRFNKFNQYCNLNEQLPGILKLFLADFVYKNIPCFLILQLYKTIQCFGIFTSKAYSKNLFQISLFFVAAAYHSECCLFCSSPSEQGLQKQHFDPHHSLSHSFGTNDFIMVRIHFLFCVFVAFLKGLN